MEYYSAVKKIEIGKFRETRAPGKDNVNQDDPNSGKTKQKATDHPFSEGY